MIIPTLMHLYSREHRAGNLERKGSWGPHLILKDRDPDTYKASHGICLASTVHCLSLTTHVQSCNKRNGCVKSHYFWSWESWQKVLNIHTVDPQQYRFELYRPTYKWIVFHQKCTTVLHKPWMVDSADVEPQIQKANYTVVCRFYFFNIIWSIYLWLCWVFVAARAFLQLQRVGATLHCSVRASHCGGCAGFSPVAARGGHSSLQCAGFSLWWLRRLFSSCSAWGPLFVAVCGLLTVVAARAFLQLQHVGATLHCSVRASHCGGFSCCGAWALGHVGFRSCGSRALRHTQ